MIVLKCYYDIVNKRLIDSYIFLLEGITPFMAMKGYLTKLFNFKMVKLFKLFASRFDSEHRL